VHGGIVQSVGQAMLEEAVYNEEGQLITGELMDYAVPRASDLPWMETARTITPSPVNPLGLKGVGEAGTIGATPALVNAVVDALSPFGVRNVDMPVKRERIWRLIRKAPASRPAASVISTKVAAKAKHAAIAKAKPRPKSKPKPKPKAKAKGKGRRAR
jgi:xanthine dehydrogenase molybdopterin-binding subunit B